MVKSLDLIQSSFLNSFCYFILRYHRNIEIFFQKENSFCNQKKGGGGYLKYTNQSFINHFCVSTFTNIILIYDFLVLDKILYRKYSFTNFIFLIFMYLAVSGLVMVHKLNFSAVCGILVPQPGIELAFPALEDGFLATELPGSPVLILNCCQGFYLEARVKNYSCISGTMVVQWLKLHAFTSGDTGSILSGRTKILHTVWCYQKKRKKNIYIYKLTLSLESWMWKTNF